MGARESLNGRKNKARRKVKIGEKSPKNTSFLAPIRRPERRRPFGTGLLRHCPQGLFSPFSTFFVPYFSARLDFPSPPLSASGSPRMTEPLYSILPSRTGIVASGQKIKTNSDPSVNRSKREPFKRSAGRYCLDNHNEAPVTETLLRRNPARLKGSLKKSKQTANRVSQNFCFEMLLTRSRLGLSAHAEADSPWQ